MSYTTKSNNGHEHANTYVRIFDDNTVQMVSYTTTVIEITPDGWLSCNGLYSMTTIKHIGWFMRELGLTYQTAKHLYRNNLMMNIFTGEIIGRV